MSTGHDMNLFPLRHTPFEQYMLTDDRRDYPMAFFIEIDLTGELSREAFMGALEKALVRHPLLTARAEWSWRGWHWIDARTPPRVEWFVGDPQLPGPGERSFDLRRESGLRLWGGISAGRARVIFQFHHAVTDGVGAMQFIGDLLAYYGQATCREGEEAPELAPIDPSQLLHRGQIWEPGHGHPKLLRSLLWWTCEVASAIPADIARRLTGRTAAPPREATPASASSAPGPQERKVPGPFVTRILESDDVAAIKRAAAVKGVTPNEIYILSMYQTLQRWNRECGRNVKSERYRVGIPVGLRTHRHADSPAANVLSYMFLTKRSRDVNDPDRLLQSIHVMSQDILRGGDSGLIPWSLGWVRRVPGLLSTIVSLPIRFCTAMLSNVSDVRRQLRCRFPLKRGRVVAGNVTLEGLLGAAPIRPGTYLGLSLGTYAKRLFINLNCDPSRFSAEDAGLLADMFVSQIRSHYVPEDAGSTSDEPAASKLHSSATIPSLPSAVMTIAGHGTALQSHVAE